MAFMISRGIIKTGLGRRIALYFIKWFGKKSLGLGYAIGAIDLITSPATPSNGARAGGIVYPLINSLANTFDSHLIMIHVKKWVLIWFLLSFKLM